MADKTQRDKDRKNKHKKGKQDQKTKKKQDTRPGENPWKKTLNAC